MNVISVDNITPSGYADVMWPFGTGFAADGVISSVAAIKAAAAVGQNIANAISFNYDNMRKIITIYNGWTSGSYLRFEINDENVAEAAEQDEDDF